MVRRLPPLLLTPAILKKPCAGKMRGSMATCAFMMGDTGGASLAEVTHDTAINDGERHTFSFSKGSQASAAAGGLGRNCISLNVDDGTAVTSCNSNCSWIETDTFWIGGLPADFDRDGQGTERTFFGGGGDAWDDTWDPAWDDSAVTSVGNFITADVRARNCQPPCATGLFARRLRRVFGWTGRLTPRPAVLHRLPARHNRRGLRLEFSASSADDRACSARRRFWCCTGWARSGGHGAARGGNVLSVDERQAEGRASKDAQGRQC